MNAVIDRLVQYPNRFQLTNISDGTVLGTFDLSPVTGTVSVVGTILNHDLFQSIADDLASRIKTEGGVVSNTTETFTMAGTRTNISSGETISVSFGKIAKIINDLKAVAFSGNKADIGLGNVDNTSDASKPVSTATQTALNAKVDKADASSTYLPFSGGRLTGDLDVGNTTIFASGSDGGFNSMMIGNDAYLGDCNIYGHIGVRTTVSGTQVAGFQFYTSDSQNLGRITFSLLGAQISTALTCTGYIQSPSYTSDNSCHIKASDSHEITIDTNDGQIWFNYANRLNNGVAATDYYFGTDGNSPTQTLANVHAKTFTGDLSGTAEKAVYDTNGASITSTYLSKADASSTYATKSALDSKQDTLTFDSVPTENSTNPITSGGVYEGLAKKLDKGDWREYQFDYVKNDTIFMTISSLENGTYICQILAEGIGDDSGSNTCYSLGVFSVHGTISPVYMGTSINLGDDIYYHLSARIDSTLVVIRGDLDTLQNGTYTSFIRFRKIADD